jgi:hypothetical protein
MTVRLPRKCVVIVPSHVQKSAMRIYKHPCTIPLINRIVSAEKQYTPDSLRIYLKMWKPLCLSTVGKSLHIFVRKA